MNEGRRGTRRSIPRQLPASEHQENLLPAAAANGADSASLVLRGLLNGESPRSPLRFPQRLRRLSVRAIQDSNLWPLAPEANALSS